MSESKGCSLLGIMAAVAPWHESAPKAQCRALKLLSQEGPANSTRVRSERGAQMIRPAYWASITPSYTKGGRKHMVRLPSSDQEVSFAAPVFEWEAESRGTFHSARRNLLEERGPDQRASSEAAAARQGPGELLLLIAMARRLGSYCASASRPRRLEKP